jgi:hypothetical protein
MGIRRKPEGAQMLRPTASPDLIGSHYTRVSGTGEAANRASAASLGTPDAPTQLKETIMRRTFTTATLLALTISAAQAGTSDQIAARIHDAAVAACAPEHVAEGFPRSHYGAIDDVCVYRISQAAMHKYQANARAKADENAKLANK